LFGKAAAHEISARCYAILSKYKEEGCGIPNGSSAHSLFSVALVYTGLGDIDEKRRTLLRHSNLSVDSMRQQECEWIMTMPFGPLG